MQQYRNPYNHQAKAEQYTDGMDKPVTLQDEKNGVESSAMSKDREIEIVEQSDADTNSEPVEQEQPNDQPNDQPSDQSKDQPSDQSKDQPNETESLNEVDGQEEENPLFVGDPLAAQPLFGSNAEVESLKAEVESLKAELENQRLRQAAEMDNFKKRLLREQSEQMQYAAEKVLSDLLPTLDNLELALQYGTTNEACKDLLQGVSMTHKLLLDAVQKHGVQPVGNVGEAFNPQIHEAVGFDQNSDQEDGSVARVLQRGYMLGTRLLRAAKVMIAKK